MIQQYPDKTINSKKYMHHYVHSSTIYNSQNMEIPKCPLSDEWLWYMYTMEYYSAIRGTKQCHLWQHGRT